MPSCTTLPVSRQLAARLDATTDELCASERLPSLLDAVRKVALPA
jgi:hypothetical protein